MTQWDMNIIESLGLLKMDFLGLRTLTVIDDAVKIVRQQGIDLDLDDVPLDDPETFKVFCDGRTSGIFQFESRGMTDLLRRVKPSRFDELAALNALYRPGALSVGMVEEYIQRKQGRKFAYLTPETQPILEETYGVIVYQEQVMLIAVAVAGFTMAEADTLRKAMGKKKADVMAKMKAQVRRRRRGARHAAGEGRRTLWDYIEPFAGYGFNKSHSVAYAMLAYKTAYLKAHYPVAFMAAMLNSELSSSDAIAKYIGECQEHGDRPPAAGHQREQLLLHRGGRPDPLRPRRGEGGGGGRDRVDPRRAPPRWAGSAASPRSPPRWTCGWPTARSSNA